MPDKKKRNRSETRKQFVRIMCIALAFLMAFSVLASILVLL